MKKLSLSLCVLVSSAFIYGQSDCMSFFPEKEGTVLISKSYDASGNPLNVITYTVEESSQNELGDNILIGCDITDPQGYVIDKGRINASCMDGNFYLKMTGEASDELFNILGTNTQLVGNFLDYPNTFTDGFASDGFRMDPGEYTLESKADKKDKLIVRVYYRQYEKNEKITTPAGTFDAAKISFTFESERDKKVQTHKGVEWYAEGAGIVRSETYDEKGNLENYTVLTELKGQ